jgi:tetratricopeptide (TPR) repeat protein
MSVAKNLCWLSLTVLFASCAAYKIGANVQSGRRALLINDPESSLGYFLEAAKGDPNYVYYAALYREGIWTYVGRAQYATKRYQEARQSLERALELDPDDNLARLYLGLTLARSNDRARGLKEIRAGMKGIYDWLEYINRSRPFEAFWDPLREMRGAIEKDLASANELTDPEQLVADAEWLGTRMENEIENVRRDERRQFERDFDRRRGPSVGVRIGF